MMPPRDLIQPSPELIPHNPEHIIEMNERLAPLRVEYPRVVLIKVIVDSFREKLRQPPPDLSTALLNTLRQEVTRLLQRKHAV